MSRRVRRRFACFARDDEGGAITMLMLVLFIGVLLLTGISLDLARHESERADLQSAVDRGVLQAASLRNSTIDEDKVREAIERFVDTRTLSESDTTVALGDVTLTPGERSIEVAAGFPMPTSFMRLAGVGSLEVGAYSSAVERDPNIELSLVLDMSGSMCQPCTKLDSAQDGGAELHHRGRRPQHGQEGLGEPDPLRLARECRPLDVQPDGQHAA